MKVLLTGISLIIITTIMLIFQSDNYNYRLDSIYLKHCCEEAANSAMLFYNQEEYAEGRKIFLENEGIKSIEYNIYEYLKKSNKNPKINYTAYFFDDDFKCNVYQNGMFKKEFEFTYPFVYEDEMMKYLKTISKPCIIVTIDKGKPTYRLDLKNNKSLIRSSSYEYDI